MYKRQPVYHDEVGDLIDTYNYMTRKMDKLMEEQVKSAEELRIAEFNSLQAQINPHFLYIHRYSGSVPYCCCTYYNAIYEVMYIRKTLENTQCH